MIQMISGSHQTHITAGVITVTTQYVMDVEDYYRWWGNLYDADGVTYLYDFYLPRIGDNYILYYNIYTSTETFWNDIVLTDISEDRQKAYSSTWFDTTGWEGHLKTLVTFTWSNTGKKDMIVPGDPSCFRFFVETNTEVSTVNLIHDVDTGAGTEVKDTYFTQKNPSVIHYYEDDDGNEQSETIGNYNSVSAYWKNYYRENNDAPEKEVYHTKTILTATLYSRYNYQFLMSDNINKINSTDFLQDVNNAREVRLLAKNKLYTYEDSDLSTVNDTERWLFFDYTITEMANNIYQYDLYFLYKPDKWTRWYGATVNEYSKINFYTALIYPFINY